MKFTLIQHNIDLDYSPKNHLDMLEALGVDVSALRARLAELTPRVPPTQRADSAVWQALERDILQADADCDPGEPWALADIQAARPTPRIDRYDESLSDAQLLDRVHGAWLGRVVGCMLGKPLEWFMKEEHSRPRTRHYLSAIGEYPLRDYAPAAAVMPYYQQLTDKGLVRDGVTHAPGLPALRENIRYACSDDDLQYTLINLRKMQALGRDFTLDDTIEWVWVRHLCRGVGDYVRHSALRNRAMGLGYPAAARFMNTGRECVRLQIRADLYGFVSPAAPAEAARLAWHDAAANGSEAGLYGALWIAACIAAAFVEHDAETIVRRGLEQIPARCRFRDEIQRTLDQCRRHGRDFDRTLDAIDARYNRFPPNWALPNCAIITAALVHGEGDFTRTLGLCMAGGYDTDSNGANVGSVLGARLGARQLPPHWVEPLNDTLHTGLHGWPTASIAGLARQTCELYLRHPIPVQ